jgi:hypothetical protein
MSITLVAVKDEFIFTHIGEYGAKTILTLSETDVLSLAQSAENFQDHIVSRHTPKGGGRPPVVTLPVDRVGLNHTLLESHLLISMFQASGREHIFSLPRHVAEALPAAISEYLATMAKPDAQPKH